MTFTTVVHSSESLSSLPYALALHSMIIAAYKRKDIHAIPLSWTRLASDPAQGIPGLAYELGPNGSLVILLENNQPVACTGFLPYRGADWIKHITRKPATATEASSPDSWELCCFCVSAIHRGQGLSNSLLSAVIAAVKERGAKFLYANYSIAETGSYWPRMGFETVLGATSVLKQGFTHTEGMEGLREDLNFAMSVKVLT